MTRTEFIRGYAERLDLSHKWARLGIAEVDSIKLIALPCGCGEPECEGWVMVSAESALGHLELNAPEPLRSAYRDAVAASGGE